MSGNNVLFKFLETVQEMLHKFISEVVHLPGAIESAINYHRKIIGFIGSRDKEKAEDKMRQHLFDVAKRIEKNMEVDLDVEFLFKVNEVRKK